MKYSFSFVFISVFINIFLNYCQCNIFDDALINLRETCFPGICKTRKCKQIESCPENYIVKIDKCNCCKECVEAPPFDNNNDSTNNNNESDGNDLCLPGDCRNKRCKQIKQCPQNHILVLDRCGCCDTCAKLIRIGEKCDEKAQHDRREICQEGLECLYDVCTC